MKPEDIVHEDGILVQKMKSENADAFLWKPKKFNTVPRRSLYPSGKVEITLDYSTKGIQYGELVIQVMGKMRSQEKSTIAGRAAGESPDAGPPPAR